VKKCSGEKKKDNPKTYEDELQRLSKSKGVRKDPKGGKRPTQVSQGFRKSRKKVSVKKGAMKGGEYPDREAARALNGIWAAIGTDQGKVHAEWHKKKGTPEFVLARNKSRGEARRGANHFWDGRGGGERKRGK